MSPAAPRVSIVLPTHDRLPLLREAVDSIRAQTVADWELIVVDDGSRDGTVEYLRALAQEEPRLVVLALPRVGRLAPLRNAGIARSRGAWVAFMDSDDSWRPDKLELQLDAHRRRPAARWSYTGRALMDAAGDPLADQGFAPWQPQDGWIAGRLLVHRAMIAVPSLLVERGLLDEVGGLDESLRYCADYDLQLRLAARAECAVVAEPLVRVRLHTGSSTRGRVEVDESFVRVYQSFAAAHPEHRAACRGQEAYYATWVARKRAMAGDRVGALRAVGFALARRPASGRAWRMLARCVLDGLRGRRPVAPGGGAP